MTLRWVNQVAWSFIVSLDGRHSSFRREKRGTPTILRRQEGATGVRRTVFSLRVRATLLTLRVQREELAPSRGRLK